MKSPNVLVLADTKDAEYLVPQGESKHWNIFWKTMDYNDLFMKASELREFVLENNIDFVVYSRNDQVANRINLNPITNQLKIGFSSFSGIDNENRINQMSTCYQDFIECNKPLPFHSSKEQKVKHKTTQSRGTFSFVFDAEQFGCFRYGIPRIFNLLDEYDVKATFFVTNIMKKVYSNAIELIKTAGHDVGIHGQWHEQLFDIDVSTQTKIVNEMKTDFSNYPTGANFVGRMDDATVTALVRNNFKYFMYLAVNYYQPFRFPNISNRPISINNDGAKILALPISLNTYSLPWFSIKNSIDSAVASFRKTDFQHITILMHPFRDGNLNHLSTTKKLLKHLTMDLGLHPITLNQLVNNLGPNIHQNSMNYKEFETIIRPKRNLNFPKTKQDFLGFSEVFFHAYKFLKKNHDVF